MERRKKERRKKVRKQNIYNALIKSSLLYGSETWRLTENNKRRVEATEMDALRTSSRISRKERISNVTIKVKVNQSRYRPGVAQRVPGS